MAPKRKKENLLLIRGNQAIPTFSKEMSISEKITWSFIPWAYPRCCFLLVERSIFQKKTFTSSHSNDTPGENLRGQMIFFLHDLYTMNVVMIYVLCIANYVLLCCCRCGKRKVSTNICATSFPSQWDSDFIRQTMHVFWGSHLWTDI